jgi:hypothetical protein
MQNSRWNVTSESCSLCGELARIHAVARYLLFGNVSRTKDSQSKYHNMLQPDGELELFGMHHTQHVRL